MSLKKPMCARRSHELNWHEHETSTGRHQQLLDMQQQKASSDIVTHIEIFTNGELVAEHRFPEGRVIVGRAPDNEIYIESKFVSRHHAQLISDNRGCVIEDLNSTNGLFLGEKQVKKYRLRHGDVVSLGVHELVYHDIRLGQTDIHNETGEEELDEEELEERQLEDQDSAVNEH